MSESAVRGMALFKGKARCILCHNGPNFTDSLFHNLGVPDAPLLTHPLGAGIDPLRCETDERAGLCTGERRFQVDIS